MARRNIFQPPPPPAPQTEPAPAESRPRFPNTGPMSGVKSTLRDLSSNAIREIDPTLIEDDGPRDRLAITDADVTELAESIRHHGQQVPIMVRPLAETPGRYRIVYGRRRLQALKLAGLPAKALIRSLSDEQAILAQGQENSLRVDPSFIEKAVFVSELAANGYDTAVILDALAIDKPMLSRMTKVARTIPASVIRFVGPAHGIGRRRWEDLADTARDHGLNLEELADRLSANAAAISSDDRFAQLQAATIKASTPARQAPPTEPDVAVRDTSGATIAEVKSTPRALTIRFGQSGDPAFTDWLRANAEHEILRLYRSWKSGHRTD
ncbi:plasmid partitioning protein RepB [Gemmobacter lutimaris]|uniref:Plasmid partitioning protein RepB n=1 Tax=Gemmobacter lutimaris TaxID=2306023 RepID=A0A398BT87_9RHOB|nr:plasmid partitioning protein RepB [Gemmobacter lutimaris]RID91140.1 plasmid partitioning protein RepB [Gemmobacter lutimaris]